jgi:ribosomal protein L11 methylase PrmA
MALERTGNGYLVDPSIWSEEVMFDMAKEDDIEADFVSEVLMGLECVSVTFSDTFDDEIFEPPVGETPLWQHVTVTALLNPCTRTIVNDALSYRWVFI